MTTLLKLREAVNATEKAIQEDLESLDAKWWISCFGRRAVIYQSITKCCKIDLDENITREEADMMVEQVQKIRQEKEGIRREYGENPPEEIKQDLVQRLKKVFESILS
jgi:hypothetical protein